MRFEQRLLVNILMKHTFHGLFHLHGKLLLLEFSSFWPLLAARMHYSVLGLNLHSSHEASSVDDSAHLPTNQSNPCISLLRHKEEVYVSSLLTSCLFFCLRSLRGSLREVST